MKLSNDEKIKIHQSLYKIACRYCIIKQKFPEDFVEGLVYMAQNKLALIEPVNDSNFLPAYWVTRPNNCIHFIFPTPPMNDNYDASQEEKNKKFIAVTRAALDEVMQQKPKKLILDLRCNGGGYIDVFYNSLYPIIPAGDGKVLSGVTLDGKEVMYLKDKGSSIDFYCNDIVNNIQNKSTINILKPEKYNIPEIEVWVNEQSASSAEIMMILFKQEGHKIIGESQGLTTGMFSKRYENYSMAIPIYVFKDKDGNLYNNGYKKHPANCSNLNVSLFCNNVIGDIPQDKLAILDKGSSVNYALANHIKCEYLNDNMHVHIKYKNKNPELVYTATDNSIYIFIPKGCNTPIRSVLDRYKGDILSNKKVIIDIRNAKLEGEECLKLFEALYKPYELPLIETTNDVDELGSFYISDCYPYITTKKQMIIGCYANINASFWINDKSASKDTYSIVLLNYFIWSFGLYNDFDPADHFKYSCYKYKVGSYQIKVKASRFK